MKSSNEKMKARSLGLKAGRPVAILHTKKAREMNINIDERIRIFKDKKEVVAVVDTALLKNENEIVLSEEIFSCLKLKEGQQVKIEPARRPVSVLYIKKKLDGKKLSRKEIYEIVKSIVENTLTEAEIAYFVAATYEKGMSMQEIEYLTRAIADIGEKLRQKGIVADKHGIGGIAGNRTTPIVVAICSAANLFMPKTSSRAITSAGGTADVMETITNVEFDIEKIKSILKKTNACIVWGGAGGLAPADDKIIQVERLLHIDPEAQLIASIMAKKLAVGATHVVLDLPYGEGTKVTKKEAERLARKFKRIAKILKINMKIFSEKTEHPIGNGIGPVLEMNDVLAVLKQEKNRPKDLEKKAIALAAILLELTKKAKKNKGKELAKKILESKKAYKKFLQIVRAQGGIKKMKFAKFKKNIRTEKSGKIKEINNKNIIAVARTAGAPANKAAGIYLHVGLGDKVKKSDILLTIYAETKKKLSAAKKLYEEIKPIIIK